MWENLLRVDWGRLNHAYGRARKLPAILRNMVSPDKEARAKGWDSFRGAVNHQGDYYDSTVAVVPFLIDAVHHPDVPERARILSYFRDRWLSAPLYGGDPVMATPPGGIDEPTPVLTDAEFAAVSGKSLGDADEEKGDEEGDEEFDPDSYRSMDLCAWQTGRAIRAGRPVFEWLLEDAEREVAAAAATLLLLWQETRGRAKQALIRIIEDEGDPVEQARRILEFGVYGETNDLPKVLEWTAPRLPAEVRAAAALVAARVMNGSPLPEPAATALRDTSEPSSSAFAKLPWEGVYHRGPWILPANAAALILRLAESKDNELRWRAVQGLEVGRETAKHLPAAAVVPVLVRTLSDPDSKVRSAAAYALSQRGEAVLDTAPDVAPALVRALDDTASSACGHAARLLAAISHRLTRAQRQDAAAGVDRAAGRFAGKSDSYVKFESMWTQATPFLQKQRGPILKPPEWNTAALLVARSKQRHQDAPLSPARCDRLLADAYARAPAEILATALRAVREASNVDAAVGATWWLVTLGPAAAPALPALETLAKGQFGKFAENEAKEAVRLIQRSLAAAGKERAVTSDVLATRNRIAALERDLHKMSFPDVPRVVSELISLLEHFDAYVRAASAELLAKLAPLDVNYPRNAAALERLLVDGESASVGVAGEFEFDGRVYHWRQQRHCPRFEAILALFALVRVPNDDRVLNSMLTESTHAAVVCGRRAIPHRFDIEFWQRAIAAAGGLAVAEPAIRAARQECYSRAHSENTDDDGASSCEAELAEVIRQLSGRLV
jgi:HEAT repeat protein